MKKAISVIAYILVVVLAGAFIFSLVKSDVTVKYGAEDLSDNDIVVLSAGRRAVFSVDGEYTVSIEPNPDIKDFDITAGSLLYSFHRLGSLNDYFKVIAEPDSFSLFVPGDITLAKIVQSVYGAETKAPAADLLANSYFRIIVQGTNGESISLKLRIRGVQN